MGTRSLTVVQEDGADLVTIYRQFDGYPSGMGKDLLDILKGMEILNGFNGQKAGEAANGMGCLAAQLVQALKASAGLGGIYIYPAGSNDCGEDYRYTISLNDGGALVMKVEDSDGPVLYDGLVDDFDPEKAEAAMEEA